MRLHLRSIAAIGAACLLATFGNVAYSQTVKLNCQGVDQECLTSEQPVQGVRIVRQSNFPTRPAFYLSSNLYTTLAAARETLNKFVAFDFIVPPGGGPLPHTHHNEWETFFVVSGTVTFTTGVQATAPYNFTTLDVPAGSVLYGPQGPVHGFVNNSKLPARVFSFAMPSGLDNFFHNSGTSVADWNAAIPPIGIDEIVRTAFWAEQRGDALYPPNTPAPVVPATTPDHVIASYSTPAINVPAGPRPTKTGPWGENRVVLLTPKEVGNITGAEAFCGPPPLPGRPGGTIEYSYISLPQTGFAADYVSPNTEVFMTLGGSLSLRVTGLNANKVTQTTVVTLEPLSFVQIDPGVPFSIANLSGANIFAGFPTNIPGQVGNGNVQTLAVTVFGPQDKNYPLQGVCPPGLFGDQP